MFTFFAKKEFLVDHLEGFIDIHNHILPGIDDGAKTIEDSIVLLKGFGAFGVTDFICTPHIMHNFYDNTPKTIKSSYKTLKKELKENDLKNVRLSYAAEHMVDDNFEHILEQGKILPLNSNHLLIEMSYLQPSINFDMAIKSIIKLQLFPVFAHPERYQYLNHDFKKYAVLKRQNIKFQLNMLSIGGYYGKDVQKTALKLLDNELYDFIGSDVHNSQHLNALKSIQLKTAVTLKVKKLISENLLTFSSQSTS